MPSEIDFSLVRMLEPHDSVLETKADISGQEGSPTLTHYPYHAEFSSSGESLWPCKWKRDAELACKAGLVDLGSGGDWHEVAAYRVQLGGLLGAVWLGEELGYHQGKTECGNAAATTIRDPYHGEILQQKLAIASHTGVTQANNSWSTPLSGLAVRLRLNQGGMAFPSARVSCGRGT